MASALDERFDITARKFHQSATVLILALAFVIGGAAGWVLVALEGVVMLLGRFWWPADIFRQLVWRVLEPAGILSRREVQEDHATRRVARVLGGLVFLAGAALLAVGQIWAWIAIGAIGVMIFLDAAFSFCALCALSYRFGRLAHR
jgi:cbb3-type cytochrome oxidase subunit 1